MNENTKKTILAVVYAVALIEAIVDTVSLIVNAAELIVYDFYPTGFRIFSAIILFLSAGVSVVFLVFSLLPSIQKDETFTPKYKLVRYIFLGIFLLLIFVYIIGWLCVQKLEGFPFQGDIHSVSHFSLYSLTKSMLIQQWVYCALTTVVALLSERFEKTKTETSKSSKQAVPAAPSGIDETPLSSPEETETLERENPKEE